MQPFVTFSLLLLVLSTLCSAQKYEITPRVRNKTVDELDLYIKQAKALPGYIPGTEPRYYIHPARTRVHGTVIVVHGFGSSSNRTKVMSSFLFRQRFNVIAVNQAGAGQALRYLPTTLLREDAGLASVRELVETNPGTSPVLNDIKSAKTFQDQLLLIEKYGRTPGLIRRLDSILNNTEFREAYNALQVLKFDLGKDLMTKKLRRYFESQHVRHDTEAFSVSQLGDSLPGPRFMLGYSLGGTYTTYASSRSSDIERAVLLAPFFGTTSPGFSDFLKFISFIGSLDITSSFSGAQVAATIAAYQAARDSITQRVREQTRVLCIMAADDSVIDVNFSTEVCASKFGGKTFVYPKDLGLGHSITPDRGSPYGEAMMRQISNYFLNGVTNNTQFLVRDNAVMS